MVTLSDAQFATITGLMSEILKAVSMEHGKADSIEEKYGLVLNAKEAAAYTGLTKGKLYQYANEVPGFPAIRDSGRTFFSRDGLAEWIHEHEGKGVYDVNE